MLKKCTHTWKYCTQCHDWGCASDGCEMQIRVPSMLSYKCATCSSKKCSLCGSKWYVCNICGDAGCSTGNCDKNRHKESGFFSSGGCKTCKNKPSEDNKWKGSCSCGWTWSKCDESKAACNNSSCGKHFKC